MASFVPRCDSDGEVFYGPVTAYELVSDWKRRKAETNMKCEKFDESSSGQRDVSCPSNMGTTEQIVPSLDNKEFGIISASGTFSKSDIPSATNVEEKSIKDSSIPFIDEDETERDVESSDELAARKFSESNIETMHSVELNRNEIIQTEKEESRNNLSFKTELTVSAQEELSGEQDITSGTLNIKLEKIESEEDLYEKSLENNKDGRCTNHSECSEELMLKNCEVLTQSNANEEEIIASRKSHAVNKTLEAMETKNHLVDQSLKKLDEEAPEVILFQSSHEMLPMNAKDNLPVPVKLEAVQTDFLVDQSSELNNTQEMLPKISDAQKEINYFVNIKSNVIDEDFKNVEENVKIQSNLDAMQTEDYLDQPSGNAKEEEGLSNNHSQCTAELLINKSYTPNESNYVENFNSKKSNAIDKRFRNEEEIVKIQNELESMQTEEYLVNQSSENIEQEGQRNKHFQCSEEMLPDKSYSPNESNSVEKLNSRKSNAIDKSFKSVEEIVVKIESEFEAMQTEDYLVDQSFENIKEEGQSNNHSQSPAEMLPQGSDSLNELNSFKTENCRKSNTVLKSFKNEEEAEIASESSESTDKSFVSLPPSDEMDCHEDSNYFPPGKKQCIQDSSNRNKENDNPKSKIPVPGSRLPILKPPTLKVDHNAKSNVWTPDFRKKKVPQPKKPDYVVSPNKLQRLLKTTPVTRQQLVRPRTAEGTLSKRITPQTNNRQLNTPRSAIDPKTKLESKSLSVLKTPPTVKAKSPLSSKNIEKNLSQSPKNPRFKNIASPVAEYINKNPSCVIRNVTPSAKPGITAEKFQDKLKKSNPKPVVSLSPRFYSSAERCLVLPGKARSPVLPKMGDRQAAVFVTPRVEVLRHIGRVKSADQKTGEERMGVAKQNRRSSLKDTSFSHLPCSSSQDFDISVVQKE